MIRDIRSQGKQGMVDTKTVIGSRRWWRRPWSFDEGTKKNRLRLRKTDVCMFVREVSSQGELEQIVDDALANQRESSSTDRYRDQKLNQQKREYQNRSPEMEKA